MTRCPAIVRRIAAPAVLLLAAGTVPAAAPHNVVLFVPDGLRAELVTPQTAPTLARLAGEGVRFANPHAVVPSLTMPNAAALLTGLSSGDYGLYADHAYLGAPADDDDGDPTAVPLVEDDLNLAKFEAAGLVGVRSLVSAALDAGYSVGLVGKYGAVATASASLRNRGVYLIDDRTGRPGGFAVAPDLRERMARSGLSVLAPGRADNGDGGNLRERGTRTANGGQQTWFSAVTTRAVLPALKARKRPFLLVYWSRDPEGTQRNHGDSHRTLEPGITGPTVLAAVRDADRALAEILESLDALGLAPLTDVVVAADHGQSTVSHASQTSASTRQRYRGVAPGELPPGFLALDLGDGLQLPVRGADGEHEPIDAGQGAHPADGSALLGADAAAPEVVVAANGGVDLVYLPGPRAAELAPRIVELLLAQDYVGGLFLDERFGALPGTLPLSAVGLAGAARTPRPALLVSFRSYDLGCSSTLLCTVEIADTASTQGQGASGSLNRADTALFAAARGPDFRTGYVDLAPASTADLGRTIAALLKLKLAATGAGSARVLGESLAGGADVVYSRQVLRGPPAANGLATELIEQRVGETRYVTAAGFRGRTVGLPPASEP